jgi:hypothetical protein
VEPFTKALLESARSLVGRELIGIRSSTELPQRARWVELLFDRDAVRVFSSDEFTDGTFELSLQGRPLIEGPGDSAVVSTADEQSWRDQIGQSIVASKIHWVESPYVALTKRRKAFSSHHYDADGAVPFSGPQAPLALELHFTNGGRVLLVSGTWTGIDQAIEETGSGITVLSDASTFALYVPRIAKELKKSW